MQPPYTPPKPPGSGFRAGYAVAAAVPLFFVLCVVGVTGYFRLGSETTALRQSLMGSVDGQWKKTIAVHLGWFTTSLVRAGSQLVKLDPEPRAAIEAVRGVEVGVYKLHGDSQREDHGAILARADKAMNRRGWVRVVGVSHDRDLVTVYMPRKGMSMRNLKCCVMVFNGRDLVVASARGNLEPLWAIAEKHLELGLNRHPLVTCAALGPGLPIRRE
ncbi:MAG TPA: hypothetical protein VNZ64_15710 [Candidatus Acidoferrum sp.]|jgi:hypothetical protein|nr:hypothetical protein [Candidatus Acidoferrum sp.]